MALGEKPDVVVPSDQAPSYQLEIEDIVGMVRAVYGKRVVGP